MAARRAHHAILDALVAQSRDTSGPLSLDRGLPLEIEAEFATELNRFRKAIGDDTLRSAKMPFGERLD